MTPTEFKAWFDGFTEAFYKEVPTSKQWKRIVERVGEIDGKSVTERVYVDRYVPQYPTYGRPYYWPYFTCGAINTPTLAQNSAVMNSNSMQQYSQTASCNQISNQGTAFNSLAAMTDFGRAEALEVA